MLEIRSKKVHPELDLAAAKKLYAGEPVSGELITSPFHLYSVERLRDELDLRRGKAVPTDVFVFGQGAPRDRRQTKVSGLPYWPKGRPWPTSAGGAPCLFLAQFCFLDSRDLVGDLPGDLLLLFVPDDDGDWLWEKNQIRLEWLTAETQPLIERLPKGVRAPAPEWYGVLHRGHDYPGAAARATKSGVSQAYNLPVLNGTKIGGAPHAIQEGGKPSRRRFICQLASIQAAPDVPYPWTNRRKKLSLEFDDTGIHGDANECVFGDMGTISVFIDGRGKSVAKFECF